MNRLSQNNPVYNWHRRVQLVENKYSKSVNLNRNVFPKLKEKIVRP